MRPFFGDCFSPLLWAQTSIDVSAARPLTSPFCIDRTVCQYSVVPSALKGNKVSVWTESSPTSSVSQGFESSTKYYPLLSLPPAESLWPYPRKGQVYPARCHHRHPLRSRRHQLPSPPWNRPETASTFVFPSLTPPPFTYLTDPRTFPIFQMTPTVTSSSSTFHFHSPCLLIFSQRKKFCILPTSNLSCQLFWLCFPWSRKKIPVTENPYTSGAQVWSLPHAYTNEIHCFLSAQLPPPTFSSVAISNFCADNSTTFAQHADFKVEFQSRFLTKPSLLSDLSPPSTNLTPSTLYATLGPPPPPRPIVISHFERFNYWRVAGI